MLRAIGDHTFVITADGKSEELRPIIDHPDTLPLHSLDALVKLVRSEAVHAEKPLYITVPDHLTVRCFGQPMAKERFYRQTYYEAGATDVPGWEAKTQMGFEEAQIALRTRFQETEDTLYAMKLLSDISCGATSVGKELGAAFYNSLPLVLDELQIKDGSPGVRLKFQQMIYELAEGIGRVRGKKTGGLQKIGTWRNCILSSGENPLIESNTAAGAANRTIEIHCQDVKLFEHNCIGDGKAVSIFLERNYGFAGKVFVKKLQQAGSLEKAMQLHDHFISEITSRSDVMDKQASSAALILAADSLMEEWIFQDGIHLEAGDLIPFLVTKAKLDQNQRALEFLHDQIAMNPVHFDPEQARDRSTEIWGDADDNYIYIIKAQFDKLLNDNGFNAENFIPWARQNGVIRIGKDGKSTVKHRILGKDTRCIWLSVASNRGAAEDDYGEDYYAPL